MAHTYRLDIRLPWPLVPSQAPRLWEAISAEEVEPGTDGWVTAELGLLTSIDSLLTHLARLGAPFYGRCYSTDEEPAVGERFAYTPSKAKADADRPEHLICRFACDPEDEGYALLLRAETHGSQLLFHDIDRARLLAEAENAARNQLDTGWAWWGALARAEVAR